MISGIKNNFKDKELNDILTNILNVNSLILNNDVIDNLIKNIMNNIDNLSYKSIILILKSFTSIYIKKIFLEKQNKNIITKEELFNKKFSDNLEFIFSDLTNNDFFNEKYKDIYYIKKTKEPLLWKQINNLRVFNFLMQQLIILRKLKDEENEKDENNLKKRLMLITLGNRNIVNNLYPVLIRKIDLCYEIFEKIK